MAQSHLKIHILTSCTGEKIASPDNQLAAEDFLSIHDEASFAQKESRLEAHRTPADDMYTGLQHMQLMEGVRQYRAESGDDSLSTWVLSAGYGLIPGDKQVVPYECTFQTMKASEVDEWATHLHIPATARKFFRIKADLVIVLLGKQYLRALQLDDDIEFASPTLFFASNSSEKFIRGKGKIAKILLSNKEAKRFSYGLVGLKGELTRRLLNLLASQEIDINQLFDPGFDTLILFDEKKKKPQVKKTVSSAIATDVDYVIQLKDEWRNLNHRSKLQYFIPEWDDRVDPDFDFLTETHSGGTGDWSNETFSHQMYPMPNYDGILVSKVVSEKTAKKKDRINKMGVHRYLRVPDDFPIMGDCGAFGYVKEEVPPYQTDEIIEYYTRLGFNYGVSLDHLIVSSTAEHQQFRYELTINNAEEFLKEHKAQDAQWIPIGAVQGWSPETYASAAEQIVKMGYKYIALGGLVRTNTKGILQILHEVSQVVPDDVNMHLFGLARLDAMSDFVKYGVNSIDSASHLRRAWLGSKDNYWTLDGDTYAAIRIPEAGKSFRAKRIVEEGRETAEKVEKMADASMKAVRDYDKGLISVEQTLDILDEYDHLITPDRASMRKQYQRTLEDKPWQKCDCAICQKDGVEVVIFRGNNRNRRRGFHNTYVFYRMLQDILNSEEALENSSKFQLPLL